jgi:tRNA dimethylallyltransferase
MTKHLIVLLGPTGVGKTALSLGIAERYGAPIISADSRQIYRDIPIATAAATPEQRARVPHYFVGTHGLEETFSAAQFEEEVLTLLDHLFETHDVVVMAGGSMMYIDAVVKGIDEMPNVDPEVRRQVFADYEAHGLEAMRAQLRLLDPDYYARVDLRNPKRVLHGIEMCLTTGRPFSSFHTGNRKERPFHIIQVGLTRPREELYARIDARVREMLSDGLLDEARRVYPQRALNSLNTVGLKEMFLYLEGQYTLEQAEERICHNTHIYSKKQMTWFKRDPDVTWFHPDDADAVMQWIEQALLLTK